MASNFYANYAEKLRASQQPAASSANYYKNYINKLSGAQAPSVSPEVAQNAAAALERAEQARAEALVLESARKQEELLNQRRQAQVDLDTAAINRIDAQLKQIRAERGEQTAADRMGDIVGAAASGIVGSTANAIGTAINAYNDPDSNRRRAESLRKVLETGYTTDGKTITPTMRYKIAQQIADLNADANRWEREDSAHNQLYGFADNVAKDTEKFTSSAKEGLGKVGQFAVDAGIAGTQLATDIAASALVPGAGLFLMGTRAFGGGAQEARQEGASIGEQVAYGVGSAATSMLTEKLFSVAAPFAKAYGNGKVAPIVKKLFSNKPAVISAASRLAKNPAGKMFLSAVSEGSEEFFESLVQPYLKNLTYSEGEKPEDVLYNFLLGAALGFVGGAGDAMTAAPRNATQMPSDAIVAAAKGVNTSAKNAPQVASVGVAGTVAKPVNPFEEQMRPQAKNADPFVEAMVGKPAQETAVQQNEQGAVGAAEQGFGGDFNRLQNQSTEFYPEGANVTDKRAIDTPVKDFEGKTISRFANNALGADAISNETAAVIEQMVADGMLSDDVLHNRDALAQAEAKINDIGIDGAMEKLRQAAARKESSPELVAMMEVLLIDAEAASTRNGERAAELAMIGAELSRSAARATQLLSHLRKMSPTYQLQAIRSSVSNYVGKEIEESAEWKDLEQKFLNAPDADSRNAAISDMQQYVVDNTKQKFGNKIVGWFTALRYMSMLGNLKTPTRNIIGNITNRAAYMVDNASVAAAEKAARGKYGRTRSVFVSPELRAIGKADADNVAAKLFDGSKYGEGMANMNANNFMRGVESKRKTFGDIDLSKFGGKSYKNPLESAKNAVDWVMNNKWFGDEAFLRSGYGRFLAGYLKANNVTAEQWNDPAWQKANAGFVEKARDNSVRLAKEAAFRQDNAFSEWIGKIGRRPDTPWYGRIIAEGVAPFRKTPANVALEILEHTPAGYASAVIKGVEAKLGAVDKNGEAKADATDVIESLAKATSGTALLGVGALLYSMGYLTGGANEDDEQAAFDDLIGKQEYAIQLDDGRSFTVDWLTPVATPFVMGAEMMKRANNDANGWETLINVLTSMSDPFLETSFVSGVKDAIDEAKYSESSAEQIAINAVLNYLTQGFTSTLGGQLERTFQEDSMTTYVDKNKGMPDFLQKAIGKASAKGLGEYNQIPYINAWGEKEAEEDFFVRAFNNLVNPAYTSKTEMDATEQELQRLYNAVGGQYGRVFPDRADKYIEFSKSVYDPMLKKNISKTEKKNLTAEEYVKYAQAKGKTSKKLVDQAVKSSEYRGMNDAEKAKLIADMYGYANYKAKKSVVSSLKNDVYAKYEEAERNGITPAEFFVHRAATNNIEADKDKNGKSINGSKKEKVIDYINSSNFSRVEKDWLYLLDYSSDDPKKNQQNLKELPWNK